MGYKKSSYLITRSGTFYYCRRVPEDLFTHYPFSRIRISLKTKSKRTAELGASHISLELEGYWSSIRLKRISTMYAQTESSSEFSNVTLSNALEYYLNLKGVNKTKLFHQSAARGVNYAIKCLGNRDLAKYSSADSGKFRDYLFGCGMASSSVRRVFSSLKSIVNLAIKEQGLNINNPFNGVYMPDLDDVRKRIPMKTDTIRIIQNSCKAVDDDMRWCIGLISDTGMRLAEAVGIKTEDIILDSDIPHILVRPNDKRRLKTKQSERLIPLVGASLWAAKRIKDECKSEYVFKRYNKTEITNAGSASAAFNKWIKPRSEDDVVVHSFRHSMRDRLRAVECPSDIIDAIGGWSKGSIGETYGLGYPLSVLQKWMKLITLESVPHSQ